QATRSGRSSLSFEERAGGEVMGRLVIGRICGDRGVLDGHVFEPIAFTGEGDDTGIVTTRLRLRVTKAAASIALSQFGLFQIPKNATRFSRPQFENLKKREAGREESSGE
ncbi:MAG: hypothetical protein Q7T82_01165, partial [Armatimonadota bacterium]|nr:hypothetical protein [Armatimonadota bacterium]